LSKRTKGQKIEIPKTDKPKSSNVVNLMDALKKSLKGGEEKNRPNRPASASQHDPDQSP
jgi:non-homologous end joining protein Ku